MFTADSYSIGHFWVLIMKYLSTRNLVVFRVFVYKVTIGMMWNSHYNWTLITWIFQEIITYKLYPCRFFFFVRGALAFVYLIYDIKIQCNCFKSWLILDLQWYLCDRGTSIISVHPYIFVFNGKQWLVKTIQVIGHLHMFWGKKFAPFLALFMYYKALSGLNSALWNTIV